MSVWADKLKNYLDAEFSNSQLFWEHLLEKSSGNEEIIGERRTSSHLGRKYLKSKKLEVKGF